MKNKLNNNTQSLQTCVTSIAFQRKRVLNLYAGIGGNRKDWDDELYEVTAIEFNEEIANIYKDLHPNDTVIVADAHEYLSKNYRNFDIIWSSPPCQKEVMMLLSLVFLFILRFI